MRRDPLGWLSEFLLTITTVPMLAMMVHITLDVFLKYVFHHPLQGTLEITSYYYMVAIVLLPMAFAERTRQSISVDIFFLMMPRSVQVVTAFFVLVFSAMVYGGFAWIAWPDAIKAFERREIVMGAVKVFIWPARFLLPLSLGLCAAVCLFQAFRLLVDKTLRDEFSSASPHENGSD